MKDKLFRIAMKHLESFSEENDITSVLAGINAIKEGYVRSNSDFVNLMAEGNLDHIKTHKALEKILKSGNEKQIIDVATYLGEYSNKGISLLTTKSLSKLFDDFEIKNKIPEKNWNLFKDKKWLKENKVTKN